MPRKTKETIEKEENKKATAKRKTTSSKSNTNKATKSAEKKPATKKNTTKVEVTKKTTTKRTTKKTLTTPEYYDLPYGYNQTVIKLLAQTPKTIFVYWEISEEDINNFINKYGDNFFNNTIPVLSVYNETKNYYFDVIINDFANSWYINVPDENCQYKVSLKRVFKESQPEQQFIEIATSNKMIIPNGHVLEMSNKVEYMNLNTKHKYFRVFYHKNTNFYNEHIEKFGLNNPSSNFGQM